MQPVDPLDQLLRGRRADPWWERWRSGVGERWPWAVAVAVIAVIVVLAGVVLVVRSPGSPADVSLPRAGADPAGSTSASAGASTTGSTVPPGLAPATTTVAGGAIVVHVAGAVRAAGLVTLPAGSRVADAVAAAGGLRPDADGDRLNLAAPVVDGVRVYVPVVGQVDAPVPVAVSGGPTQGAATGEPSPAAPVDLNTATVAELEELPGVGPSTAAAIVAYRDEHGRFGTVDELQEVRGIGPAKFEALEPLVAVGP